MSPLPKAELVGTRDPDGRRPGLWMDGVDTGLAIGKDVSVNIGENGAHLLTFSILADEVILPARQIGARA